MFLFRCAKCQSSGVRVCICLFSLNKYRQLGSLFVTDIIYGVFFRNQLFSIRPHLSDTKPQLCLNDAKVSAITIGLLTASYFRMHPGICERIQLYTTYTAMYIAYIYADRKSRIRQQDHLPNCYNEHAKYWKHCSQSASHGLAGRTPWILNRTLAHLNES